jgi:hypothetical protein
MTQELTLNTNRNLTLSERLSLKKSGRVLLLDVSGSMSSDCEPGKTKIDALREVVAGIKYQPKMFAFSSDTAECDKDTIPRPNGGTRLGRALAYMKDKGHDKIIVITDGMVDDPDLCLEMAKKTNIQIFYIGVGEKPKFLEELAAAAGGNFCTKEDISAGARELQGKLQLLLGPGDSSVSGGPICL